MEELEVARFPLDDFTLAIVSVRAAVLAGRLGMTLRAGDEDGLGPVCGFACRLPSGLQVATREMQHAMQHLGVPGPEILVDAGEVERHGFSAVLSQVLDAFGLSPANVAWTPGPDADGIAAARAEMSRNWLARAAARPIPAPPGASTHLYPDPSPRST